MRSPLFLPTHTKPDPAYIYRLQVLLSHTKLKSPNPTPNSHMFLWEQDQPLREREPNHDVKIIKGSEQLFILELK